MKYYIYAHKRLTDNKVFYLGKGSLSRSKTTSSRNKKWKNIVSKHGFKVVIVREFTDEKECYRFEIAAIRILRAIGCDLANIADGGEGGLSGHNLSNEHKEKLRKAKLGVKQRPEFAARSASLRVGAKNTPDHIEATAAAKRKIVINSNGELFSSATDAANKMSKRTGQKSSQGNISMCCRGERNLAYGLSWSYELRKTPSLRKNVKTVINKTTGKVFSSVKEAASFYGVASQCISRACRNETAKSNGCYWGYIEQ